jgi:hypothetical protein
MRGRAPSLLELDDRPAAYEDVGRLCTWDDLFPLTLLPRSRYERVLTNAVSGRRVRLGGAWHKPIGIRGWTHVVFRREADGARHVRSLDDLLVHLDAWDRSADRRTAERRVTPQQKVLEEQRLHERRVDATDTSVRRRQSDVPVAMPPVHEDGPARTTPSPILPRETPADERIRDLPA